jgi:hypothetical protein
MKQKNIFILNCIPMSFTDNIVPQSDICCEQPFLNKKKKSMDKLASIIFSVAAVAIGMSAVE